MTTCSVRRAGVLIVCCLLVGCGLTQMVKDGAVNTTKALFYKQIKTLHLDFTSRAALNVDGEQVPLSVMVRVYQLKDRKSVDAADYRTLLGNADTVLKNDLLASREVLVMPGGDVSLDMPLDADAKFVAVVGLFNRPDMKGNKWYLVLKREDLDADEPRTVELADGWLNLLPLKE